MNSYFRRTPLLVVVPILIGFAQASHARADVIASAARCPYRPTHSVPLAMDSEDYPLLSIAQNEQGNVVLDFLINRDGSVADVNVARSSGFARLDGAAADAARQRWHFDPVLVDGKPISCRNRVAVSWRLEQTPEQLARFGFTIEHMDAADFPAGSLTRGEHGASVVMAFVQPTGKILHANVSQSSGFSDLDKAAVDAALKGRWAVVPPQVAGKSVSAMIGFVVIWPPGR